MMDERILTSRDHVALQFYWQGYPSYIKAKERESVVPCFYNAHCDDTSDEFVRIVPIDETPARTIRDEMRVQILSVATGKYLRATRVSKYLRWSATRDDQTIFQVQLSERHKPLTTLSKFTLESCFWASQYVGFSQSIPLGGSRALSKAIGFLTIEKKKHQPSLLFPLRLRAVHRDDRHLRDCGSPTSVQQQQLVPIPLVTPNDMVFVDHADELEQYDDVPLAIVPPVHEDEMQDEDIFEPCTYCGILFRRRSILMAHIHDNHRDWLERPCIPNSFCAHCGRRKTESRCARCEH